MIKLGQTTTGGNKGVKYMWLVKDMDIYRKYSKAECYVVLGFYPGSGWGTLYNGTLKKCREFMGDVKVVTI